MEKAQAFKLTQEIADVIKSNYPAEKFLESFKDIGADTGVFEIIISTNDIDRHGEIVSQTGIEIDQYLKNPVVLWAHDHDELPIAIADKVYRKTIGTQEVTIAEGRFAPHAFAQEVRNLYELKMIRTASIGFIPKEWEGNMITKSELIEFSFVPVPANPYAISLLAENADKLTIKGLGELFAKGLMIKETTTEPEAESKPEEEEKPTENAETPTEQAPTEEKPTEETQPADEEKSVEKAGRVISSANEQKIRDAISALEEVLNSLPTENSQHSTEGAIETTGEIKEAEEFLKFRKSMQDVSTLIGEALHQAGIAAKKLYTSSK
jgi:hypothetical protein